MSRDDSTGFAVAEKFFALLIILVGTILLYNTSVSPRLAYPLLFAMGGLTLIALGIFMILARAK